MRISIEDRFWKSVNKTDGCWVWTSLKDRGGYGRFFISPKMLRAHRVAWELTFGEIPAGMTIDHICNRRDCVNPDHLRVATLADNLKNRKLQKNNSSGYKGVCWDRRRSKWLAQIQSEHNHIVIGLFDSPKEAHKAYCEAADRIHRQFANHGDK